VYSGTVGEIKLPVADVVCFNDPDITDDGLAMFTVYVFLDIIFNITSTTLSCNRLIPVQKLRANSVPRAVFTNLKKKKTIFCPNWIFIWKKIH